MKTLLLIGSLFHVSLFFSQMTISGSITSHGDTRTYRIYVPAMYDGSQPVPLVLNFHGYGSNSSEQEAYGDFRPIADTANFLVVHPQGQIVSGNTGWHTGGTVANAQVDIDFVSDLIDTLSAQYSIDPNRIYATGMSNGGYMSHDLACFLSTRIAAIASVTGNMTGLHKNSCNPAHPMPVMQIHGTADAVVSYSGSGGSFGPMHIDSLVKFWRTFNECDPNAVFTTLPDVITTDGCTAEHYVYQSGLEGSTVEFYKIINGGHTWPGALFPVSGNTNMDFSASKEIWRFFSQYRLNELTAELPSVKNEYLSIYPNPTQGTFMISTKKFKGTTFELYTVEGKLLYGRELKGEHTEIDFPESASGTYIYFFKNEHRLISRGRLIRE